MSKNPSEHMVMHTGNSDIKTLLDGDPSMFQQAAIQFQLIACDRKPQAGILLGKKMHLVN